MEGIRAVTASARRGPWPRDAGMGEQRLADAGPCVDEEKRTAATNVRLDVQALGVWQLDGIMLAYLLSGQFCQ